MISDLSFVDTQNGWLIGATCSDNGDCSLAMRITRDGGQTWQPSPAPNTGFFTTGGPPPTHNVRSLRFANQEDGWAFALGLFTTHDGGQTWQDTTLDQPAITVEPADNSVWLVKGNCTGNPKCSYQLLTLNPDSQTWQPLPVQPSIRGPELQLVRPDDKHAWILSWGALNNATDKPYGSALVATQDAGRTWQSLPSPCEKEPVDDRLAAFDSSHVWALCGGLPGAGQQLKYLVISSDGGQTWGKPVDLESAGYVDDLAVATAQRGFIGIGRGTLSVTENSGMTWKPALGTSTANLTDTSGWRIMFIDPQHGWVAIGNTVFRTTDGGVHWIKTDL